MAAEYVKCSYRGCPFRVRVPLTVCVEHGLDHRLERSAAIRY